MVVLWALLRKKKAFLTLLFAGVAVAVVVTYFPTSSNIMDRNFLIVLGGCVLIGAVALYFLFIKE